MINNNWYCDAHAPKEWVEDEDEDEENEDEDEENEEENEYEDENNNFVRNITPVLKIPPKLQDLEFIKCTDKLCDVVIFVERNHPNVWFCPLHEPIINKKLLEEENPGKALIDFINNKSEIKNAESKSHQKMDFNKNLENDKNSELDENEKKSNFNFIKCNI